MAHSSWLLWLFLCCVAGQATPGEQREPVAEALGYRRTQPRPNLQDQLVALGQRAVLWLVSTVGLYGLTSLLDDFPDKQKNESPYTMPSCHAAIISLLLILTASPCWSYKAIGPGCHLHHQSPPALRGHPPRRDRDLHRQELPVRHVPSLPILTGPGKPSPATPTDWACLELCILTCVSRGYCRPYQACFATTKGHHSCSQLYQELQFARVLLL
ncbi:glycoprotein hormone alpha-2 isoform X2 [Mauremys mutica]|uniref:glycoprotein hormone alpha-2 isoform X2 n=1 Tax=Mauremys mutica TaxID=74926 RepID=UPI001D167058|nr:glycoprotein hormone alpha-2 isoform X2 [Mauremys mutica]